MNILKNSATKDKEEEETIVNAVLCQLNIISNDVSVLKNQRKQLDSHIQEKENEKHHKREKDERRGKYQRKGDKDKEKYEVEREKPEKAEKQEKGKDQKVESDSRNDEKSSKEIYRCKNCEFILKTKEDLASHMNRYHIDGEMLCHICEK